MHGDGSPGTVRTVAKPIEMLEDDEIRLATEIVLNQIFVFGDDVSWDWELRSLSRREPLAVNAYRSTLSEPPENLEISVGLTLERVGLQLEGEPVKQRVSGTIFSRRYRVGRRR